jgi:hypothetical protein
MPQETSTLVLSAKLWIVQNRSFPQGLQFHELEKGMKSIEHRLDLQNITDSQN